MTLKERLEAVIREYNDKPVMVHGDPDAAVKEGTCVECAKEKMIAAKPDAELTVKTACMRALVANLEEDTKETSQSKKLERAELFYKLKKFDSGSTLKASETVLILDRVNKVFNSPLVLFQVKDAIEGVD